MMSIQKQKVMRILFKGMTPAGFEPLALAHEGKALTTVCATQMFLSI